MGSIRAFVFPLMVAALLSRACGVSFSDNFDGTELFKGISLSGAAAAGGQGPACVKRGSDWSCTNVSQLTVNLTITDGYPAPVRIACFMEADRALSEDDEKLSFQERAQLVAEKVLEPPPGRNPGDKEIDKQSLDLTFPAPPPGSYFLACNTPAAEDNGLGLNFRVEG